MILCTAYGLLIYECMIDQIAPKENENEAEESKGTNSRRERNSERENDKPRIALNATYKLSVLPDERVLDCLSFETTQNEA